MTFISRLAALILGLVAPLRTMPALSSGLPAGDERDMVEGACTACHNVNQITRSSGYTRDDWQSLMATMIDLFGRPEAEREIAGYLADHFPPHERRAPVIVPGETGVTFEEWVVPIGARSR